MRQGLPQSLPAGAYVYNQSANILTGDNINWALTGVRNTLALNLFYLKTELLPDARIPPTFLNFNNNIQQGGGVTLSHILTPVISLNGTLSTQLHTRIRTDRRLEDAPGPREPAGQLADEPAHVVVRRHCATSTRARAQHRLPRLRIERVCGVHRAVPSTVGGHVRRLLRPVRQAVPAESRSQPSISAARDTRARSRT